MNQKNRSMKIPVKIILFVFLFSSVALLGSLALAEEDVPAKTAEARAEIDSFCNLVKGVMKTHPGSHAAQVNALSVQVSQELKNRKVLKAINVVTAVDPKNKYKVLIQFARKDLGMKNWDCPEFKKFASGH